MHRNTFVASALALAGTALAQSSPGNAILINSCNAPIYMQNTPSTTDQYSVVSQTIQPGAQYTQEFTQLSNGGGWSIKVSMNGDDWTSDLLQYEYTWDGTSGTYGGLIWFDVSMVNGNGFSEPWYISGTGSCDPAQTFYGVGQPNDNYASQSCDAPASITVDICKSASGSTGGSSSEAPSSVATSSAPQSTSSPVEASPSSAVQISAAASAVETSASEAQPTSTAEASQTSQSQPQFTPWNGGSWPGAGDAEKVNNGNKHKDAKGTPTTLATVATPNRGGVTVTEVATQVVTNFVTATAEAAAAKRHEHVARHAHHHHF